MEKEIDNWRIKIDEIDEKLVELFNLRAEYANKIGIIKKKQGIPVYNPDRENQIFKHIQLKNQGPLSNGAVKRLFERIIDETRRLEREKVERGDE